jgi:predicted anti-sigma-YlaC factor YlaD
MNCEETKAAIPSYINHTASETQVGSIEEHLCICNDCRQFLSQAIDNKPRVAPVKEKIDTTQTETPVAAKKLGIGLWEYIVLGIGVAVLVFFIYLFFKG